MTPARMVKKGDYVMITRSCLLRWFFLRPDAAANQAILYCLGLALKGYGMQLVGFIAESNHIHYIVKDPHGNYPAFATFFHSLVARVMNRLRGRKGKFWHPEEMNVVRLLDRATVIRKLVYVFGNPVKDLLVERAIQWPGVSLYRAFLQQRSLRVARPHWFNEPDSHLPEEVEVSITIPEDLGRAEDVIAEVRAGVEVLEHKMAKFRARRGRRILGRRAIREQDWRSGPTQPRKEGRVKPRFAGPREARAHALTALKQFWSERDRVRRAWRLGDRVDGFPAGTYRIDLRIASTPKRVAVGRG